MSEENVTVPKNGIDEGNDNANDTSQTKKTYAPLTPKLMMELAAPHTWAASIFPVLIGTALAQATLSYEQSGFVDAVMCCILLLICILFQSAVNTVNDYYDYVKGTDTKENQDDPTDAVLVYNNVNPRSALAYAIGLIVIAFALGLYVISQAGMIPLVIAIVGVIVIFLYSGGKTPISYLPIGELVSGFVMGGLITLAVYQVLTLEFSWMVLVYSIPQMLGIGLIMFTNNGSDIEKDIQAHRKTMPVLVGRARVDRVYNGVVYAWTIAICVIVLAFFIDGWVILPFMLIAVHPLAHNLMSIPLGQKTRGAKFGLCTSLNIALGTFYALAIMTSALVMAL